MGDDLRFPYANLGGISCAEVDSVIRGVTQMARCQIRRLNCLRTYRFAEFELDEVYANCLNKIWEKHLPRFDATNGNKLSTFLFTCIHNFILEEFRRLSRDRIRAAKRTVKLNPYTVTATDETLDYRVEQIAEDILKRPELHFTPEMVNVLRVKLANPGMSMKDLASKLGYELSSSLSMMLQRMREIVKEIDIESYVASAPRKHRSRQAAAQPVSPPNSAAGAMRSPKSGANRCPSAEAGASA